jgi:phosphoserine / homoserine phosphotransferase
MPDSFAVSTVDPAETVSHPVASDPASSDPASSNLAASNPASSNLAASNLAASNLAASNPAPSDAGSSPTQCVVTLDLEGVLVPEIWIAVAERTGIDALRRTTRDEPNYDTLMKYRLALLEQHGLTMSVIDDVIGGLSPLPGAREFLDELRRRTQVIILSDTFEQFGRPLMAHLGRPTLLCHRLVVENDRIVDYRLRMPDQKRHAVNALRGLNYRVIAAGDSYNDTAMLGAAHAGFLFHAPDNVIAEFPQFRSLTTFPELLDAITAELT